MFKDLQTTQKHPNDNETFSICVCLLTINSKLSLGFLFCLETHEEIFYTYLYTNFMTCHSNFQKTRSTNLPFDFSLHRVRKILSKE